MNLQKLIIFIFIVIVTSLTTYQFVKLNNTYQELALMRSKTVDKIKYSKMNPHLNFSTISPDYELPRPEFTDEIMNSNIKNLQDFIQNNNRDFTKKLWNPNICQEYFDSSKTTKLLLAICRA